MNHEGAGEIAQRRGGESSRGGEGLDFGERVHPLSFAC